MTGYPEAVLARELEICYAAIALVTDLDAGVAVGEGVKAVDVFAQFEKNMEMLKKLVREAIGQVAVQRTCTHCLPHDGVTLPIRAAVRVLLTGAAGFIGSRVGAALRAAGHDVVGIDVLLPAAHGSDSVLPEGCRQVDVRDADALAPLLAGVDLVCHQAAMVGAGVDAADAPAYGGHNDFATTVLLAQMFAAGVRRLVLASSMVVYGQGNYACPDHGLVDPLPRRRADLDAGVFEHRCPACGDCRSPGGSSTRMPRCGRAACTRPARPRRSITRWRGRSRAAARWWRCAITTSTDPGCRATPPIPGWPRSSARHWKKTSRQGFSRTAGRCVTSCTSTTWPRRTCAARSKRTVRASRRSMSVPGGRSRSSRWPPH